MTTTNVRKGCAGTLAHSGVFAQYARMSDTKKLLILDFDNTLFDWVTCLGSSCGSDAKQLSAEFLDNVINQGQYSVLVATVIGSAIIPTLIANAFFLPRHLMPQESNHAAQAPSDGNIANVAKQR